MYPVDVASSGQDAQALVHKPTRVRKPPNPQNQYQQQQQPPPPIDQSMMVYMDNDVIQRLLIFFADWKTKTTAILSTARDCVLVAAAALAEISTSTEHNNKKGQNYLNQAKRLVANHISDPNVCAVVGAMFIGYCDLILLKNHDACWTWVGIASRMCQQLDLHRLPQNDFGYQVHWNVVAVDRIVSMEALRAGSSWQVEPDGGNNVLEIMMAKVLAIGGPLVSLLTNPQYLQVTPALDLYKHELSLVPNFFKFCRDNLLAAKQQGQLDAFVTTHFWLHAIKLLLAYPSLAIKCSPLIPKTTAVSHDMQSLTLKSMIDLVAEVDASALANNPLIAQPICIAATCAYNIRNRFCNDDEAFELLLDSAYSTYCRTLATLQQRWSHVSNYQNILRQLEEEHKLEEISQSNDYWSADMSFLNAESPDDGRMERRGSHITNFLVQELSVDGI